MLAYIDFEYLLQTETLVIFSHTFLTLKLIFREDCTGTKKGFLGICWKKWYVIQVRQNGHSMESVKLAHSFVPKTVLTFGSCHCGTRCRYWLARLTLQPSSNGCFYAFLSQSTIYYILFFPRIPLHFGNESTTFIVYSKFLLSNTSNVFN